MSGLFKPPRNFVKHDFDAGDRPVTVNALYGLENVAGSNNRPAADDHVILAVIDGLLYLHASLKRWRNRRRTLCALADLDEAQLRDIGLTRDDPMFDSSFRWPGHRGSYRSIY